MHDETDIELPQALIDRLAEQDRTVALLTPQVERRLVADAQRQFASRADTPAAARSPHWGLAAAAAAALVFVIVTLRDPALPGDYDGSGSVDVLDAFALTRALDQNPQFAANDSVESLMQRIVALDGGMQ